MPFNVKDKCLYLVSSTTKDNGTTLFLGGASLDFGGNIYHAGVWCSDPFIKQTEICEWVLGKEKGLQKVQASGQALLLLGLYDLADLTLHKGFEVLCVFWQISLWRALGL